MAALLLALSLSSAAQELSGVTVVIDPGHGDRKCGEVPADPGAHAESLHGTAWECVFTWDTSMRLRQLLLERGAKVELTLEDPEGNYKPQAWSPDNFPTLEEFEFKTLRAYPEPKNTHQALMSRVETANRVYHDATGPVYFLSLHFDSTSPRLAGISFYYPAWPGAASNFVVILEEKLRATNRQRIDLRDGAEVKLSSPANYAVLEHSLNPESYLIELGNIRSLDHNDGNPDLWRMRHPEVREEYAALLCETLLEHRKIGSQPLTGQRTVPSPARGHRLRVITLLAVAMLTVVLLVWASKTKETQ